MHSSLDLQPPFNEISHKWYPASDPHGAFGVLTLSGPVYAKVYFHEAAEIDRVIAGLVALRAEMTAEPASPEAVAALAGSITAGTPLLVVDDRSETIVHDCGGSGQCFCGVDEQAASVTG